MSMSNQPAKNEATALDRWKALAKIENKIARKNWGAPIGSFVKPATPANPEEQAAREQRDAQIEAWADEGMSVKDISSCTGLADTSINRILRVRRLEARTVYNRPANQANNTKVVFARF